MRVLVPVVETRDGRLLVSPHFGGATSFIIIEVVGGECHVVDRLDVGPGPGGRGRVVVPWAAQRGVEAVVAREMGPGAYEAFTAAGIRVYYAESLDPCEAARAVAEGRARPFDASMVTPGRGLGRGMGGGHRHGWRWHQG